MDLQIYGKHSPGYLRRTIYFLPPRKLKHSNLS